MVESDPIFYLIDLLNKIINSNNLGYSVLFRKSLNQYIISCKKIDGKEYNHSQTMLPEDHMTIKQICDAIDFNIDRIKKM